MSASKLRKRRETENNSIKYEKEIINPLLHTLHTHDNEDALTRRRTIEVGLQNVQLHGISSPLILPALSKYSDVCSIEDVDSLKKFPTSLAFPTFPEMLPTATAVAVEMLASGVVMLTRNNDVSARKFSTSHTMPVTELAT